MFDRRLRCNRGYLGHEKYDRVREVAKVKGVREKLL